MTSEVSENNNNEDITTTTTTTTTTRQLDPNQLSQTLNISSSLNSTAGKEDNNNLINDTENNDLASNSHPSNKKNSSNTTPHTPNTYIHTLVSDPQKEQDGSQNAYISYLITTNTNVPTFQSSVVKVRRRFSDFYFLYSFLLNEYPACAVPPLPDKNRLEYIKGDRFGPEFTLKRATSLNRFLNRISLHPILKKASTFLIFLESNDWNAHKRSLTIRQTTSHESPSVLDGFSDSLLNAFAKINIPNDEFIELRDKMDKLDDNLLQVEKSFLRVIRRESDLSHDFDDLSEQLIRLAGLEQNLESEFISFANATAFISRAIQTLKDQTDGDYLVSLRDLQNYVTSMKALLKLKEQKQLDYEALTDYLSKAEAEKQSIISGAGSKNFFRARIEDVRGIDHENAKSERLRKLESKINSLSQEVDHVKSASETFQDLAINEFAVFENTKAHEMKETLNTLADNHIIFYQSLISEWTSLLKT